MESKSQFPLNSIKQQNIITYVNVNKLSFR